MGFSKLATTVDSFQFVVEDLLYPVHKMNAFLSIIGLLVVGKFAVSTLFEILTGLKVHFLSRVVRKDLVKTYGKWAVVTGCTDGIGKAYMLELARRGLNIVLVSRNISKLEACSKEVREKYGVETEICQVDFTDGKSIYHKIEAASLGKEIGILVNNVGVMMNEPKALIKATDAEIWSQVNVNVASIPVMMKMFLPQMLKRNQGAIVNVSSIASTGPVPYMGIYSASKAFVDYISLATAEEYKHTGITIQTLIPSFIATNMTSFSDAVGKANFAVPDAETYARNAINTLGYSNYTTGFWPFGIQKWSTQFMTRSMFMFSTRMANIFFTNGRAHQE